MLSTYEFVRLQVKAQTNLHQVDASACRLKTEFPSKTAPSGQIATPAARKETSRLLGEFEGPVIKINMLSTDEFVRLQVRARTNLHQVDASACQLKTEFPSKTAPSGQIATPAARKETSRLRGSKKICYVLTNQSVEF
jgi:hypothetical protein